MGYTNKDDVGIPTQRKWDIIGKWHERHPILYKDENWQIGVTH